VQNIPFRTIRKQMALKPPTRQIGGSARDYQELFASLAA